MMVAQVPAAQSTSYMHAGGYVTPAQAAPYGQQPYQYYQPHMAPYAAPPRPAAPPPVAYPPPPPQAIIYPQQVAYQQPGAYQQLRGYHQASTPSPAVAQGASYYPATAYVTAMSSAPRPTAPPPASHYAPAPQQPSMVYPQPVSYQQPPPPSAPRNSWPFCCQESAGSASAAIAPTGTPHSYPAAALGAAPTAHQDRMHSQLSERLCNAPPTYSDPLSHRTLSNPTLGVERADVHMAEAEASPERHHIAAREAAQERGALRRASAQMGAAEMGVAVAPPSSGAGDPNPTLTNYDLTNPALATAPRAAAAASIATDAAAPTATEALGATEAGVPSTKWQAGDRVRGHVRGHVGGHGGRSFGRACGRARGRGRRTGRWEGMWAGRWAERRAGRRRAGRWAGRLARKPRRPDPIAQKPPPPPNPNAHFHRLAGGTSRGGEASSGHRNARAWAG